VSQQCKDALVQTGLKKTKAEKAPAKAEKPAKK
jgi:hypothetical protein